MSLTARRNGRALVRAPRAAASVRGAGALGGGLIGLAALIAAVGTLADQGLPKAQSGWVLAAIIVGASGVIVGAVGVVGVYFTRTVTDAHAATLHATATQLIGSLSLGNVSNYAADGHRPREAFRAHFRRLAKALDRWDGVRTTEAEDKQTVLDRVKALAVEHRIDTPTYETARIITYTNALLMSWARDGRRHQPTSLQWKYFMSTDHRMGVATPIGGDTWVTLQPFEGESAEDWTARARLATDLVDAFFADAQALPEVDAWIASVRSVRKYVDDEMPALLDALRFVLEMEHQRRARRCPTC